MKNLRWMQFISRVTGYRIGIHRGRSEYYYLVHSITGEKYRPCLGIITTVLSAICFCLAGCAGLSIGFVLEEYETFGVFTILLVACLARFTYASAKMAEKLLMLFERRPDELDEDYEPSAEEIADWDKWVH